MRPALHDVPAALSSLVGRQRELAAVDAALDRARLVTLVGPGGAGKTRLAREVAARRAAAGAHPDGVRWVELAPVGAGPDVGTTLAGALGVSLPPGRPVADVLDEALRGPGGAPRRLLLVLDNCEHLVDDVATLAERLLRGAPGLAVLATSREALAIEGEVAWPVPPLARPPLADACDADPAALAATLAGYEAVQLFVERARAAHPGFALAPANAAAVAAICARLDGLPLALELAAATLPALGVEALAARLDDALALLTRGRRTALPRHRTLRAVLDWSYRLLDPGARTLLDRLSVFRGAFTLDAAEAVGARPDAPDDPLADGADVVAALGRLVEHSLVEVREGEGATRYRLLETVRQFGAAQLDAGADARGTRARHARWLARVAAEAEPDLFGPARGRTVERLKRDVDELRAALAWATGPDGAPMTAVRLAGALGWFWFSGVPWEEARALLAATLAAADAEGIADADRPLADRVALGTFFYPHTGTRYFAGDADAVLALSARELALWDTVDAEAARAPHALTPAQHVARTRGRTLAHQLRGLALAHHGARDAAVAELGRSLATAEAGGERWLAAVMRLRRALVHLRCGDPAAADADYRAAVPLLRALGESWFLSLAHEGMAAGALLTGALAEGVRDARRAVRVLREERDAWFASRAVDTLAALLAAAAETSDDAGRGGALDADVAHAALARSDAARGDARAHAAVRFLGAAAALRRRCGALVSGPDVERQARVAASLRARLGDPAYAAGYAAGEALTLDDVLAAVDDDAAFEALGLGARAAATSDPTAGPDAPVAASPSLRRATPVDAARAVARTLRIDVLGPFAVAADGVVRPAGTLPGGKARELVLFLLLHPQATKEEIALALWPDASPAQVRNGFHVTLHHLRRQLGDARWIAHAHGTYGMPRVPADGLALDADVHAVLDAAARLQGAARRPADARSLDDAALDAARGALARLRGDLGADVAAGEWLAAHRTRVHAAWGDAMETLARLLAAAGRHADARAVGERLVAREPLRESAHRQLMAALVALGEAERARAHYAALERLLDRAVGVRPSRETRALAEAISG